MRPPAKTCTSSNPPYWCGILRKSVVLKDFPADAVAVLVYLNNSVLISPNFRYCTSAKSSVILLIYMNWSDVPSRERKKSH